MQLAALLDTASRRGWYTGSDHDLCHWCAERENKKEEPCQHSSMLRTEAGTSRSQGIDGETIPASDAALPSSLQGNGDARKTALETCSASTGPDGSGNGSQN